MTAVWLGAAGAAALDLIWQGVLVVVVVGGVRAAAGTTLPRLRGAVASGGVVALALLIVWGLLAVAAAARSIPAAALSGPESIVDPGAHPALLPWLGGVWLVIAALSLARVAGGWAGVRRLVARGAPVTDAPTLAAFHDALARVRPGREVRLREVRGLATPVVAGWLRPVILVPARFGSDLARAHCVAILVHELVHVRRRDYETGVLRHVAGSLVRFHPAVAWLERWSLEAREEACDDATAGLIDRLVYARALERLERQRSATRRLRLAPAMAPTVARIVRLVSPARVRTARVSLALMSAAVLGAGIMASAPARHERHGVALSFLTAPLIDIRARDPAGEFTLTLRAGRAVAATIEGTPVPSHSLVQRGDRVTLPGAGSDPAVAVHITDGGRGIRWSARPAR